MAISGISQSAASYNAAQNNLYSNIKRLSSGTTLPTDDPAGVGISSRLRSQFNATEMAGRNISNAISMTKTSSGFLQQVNDNLSRMKALSVQAGGILSATDRQNVETEFKALQDNISSITSGQTASAQFNDVYLLRGGTGEEVAGGDIAPGDVNIQSGSDMGQATSVSLPNLDISNDEVIGNVETYEYDSNNQVSGSTDTPVRWNEIIDSVNGLNIDDPEAIGKLDEAINHVSEASAQNATEQVILEEQYAALQDYEGNLRETESKIRDTDMAYEAMSFSANSIQNQAALAMQIQGQNISNQSLLFLLQNNQ